MITLEQMKNSLQDNFPEYIIVHHTGGTNKFPLFDTSNQTFKIVQDYHISLGWENFGYHWFIEKSGKIVEGRPEHYHGAHTKNYNNNSIGICLAGNFDATLPTQEQEVSLKKLINDILTRYPKCKDKIYPHRKFANKSCYGNKLSDTWASDLLKVADEEYIKIPKRLLVELTNYIK